MRGKLIDRYLCGKVDRITPAHAGKTDPSSVAPFQSTDHPRTCGENCTSAVLIARNFGSPPHMRGKRIPSSLVLLFQRITPAHAGKTFVPDFAEKSITDHPRTCGENWVVLQSGHDFIGSPPHMRGKPSITTQLAVPYRITPAHAGKTEQPAELMREETDHPRTCGENFFVFINEFFPFGSPPHMRGKPFGAAIRSPPLRITPAHAGKTPDNDQKEVGYSDHPRTCGENIGRHHQCCCFNGSPPHMRGKPSALSSIAPSIPDHPRTCGEN